MNREKFSWKKRARSFVYAFRGIVALVRDEHNARIHTAAAVVALGLGVWLGLSPAEWTAVALCIGGVFAAEAFNSAIESLADRVTTERDEAIKRTKDLAAGGVLLFVLGALAVGAIIFIPKLIALI